MCTKGHPMQTPRLNCYISSPFTPPTFSHLCFQHRCSLVYALKPSTNVLRLCFHLVPISSPAFQGPLAAGKRPNVYVLAQYKTPTIDPLLLPWSSAYRDSITSVCSRWRPHTPGRQHVSTEDTAHACTARAPAKTTDPDSSVHRLLTQLSGRLLTHHRRCIYGNPKGASREPRGSPARSPARSLCRRPGTALVSRSHPGSCL
ncbi:hypothetical protein NDU88_003300 [Pleurodeles waltl]|uniref:Uncharacterized protein n=1 Tax=Pleurodeles waltl TaxID=8319 RepID=A0AAV7UY27_PLEWA|nr:hypothetical protein NDU88_003300 [Pleurodeles waltl]